MNLRFRTKIFATSFGVAAAALTLAAGIFAWELRQEERTAIERRLLDQARLVAEVIARDASLTATASDEEADRLATAIEGRVTLIAADGRVVGDSSVDGDALARLDNHLERPEVRLARAGQVGAVERYSVTLQTDMLYTAIPVVNPLVAYVRVALPRTAVASQVTRVGAGALLALALATPVAIGLAWLSSMLLSRRVQAIATIARRYSRGDLAQPHVDYGDDELGDVARVLDVSVRDVARRADELARDRAQMEAILSGMNEGILVLTSEGRVLLANRAAQKMLHVDASITGRLYLEVVRHPEISAQLTKALRGETSDPHELSVGPDASRVFVARAAPITPTGSSGAILVLHEITDLRRADTVRRDFVANVSHELRTPLTAIRGYVEALLDQQGLDEETRRFLEIISRQSSRMERLVADLLRLARLDARQETLELTTCEVERILRTVLTDLQPVVDAKRQQITISVAPDATQVPADAAKLQDIVRNLVENAVNYSPEKADIRIEASRRADAVAIVVSDSGPGIPASDLTRVFERFYRVDKARARPGGTGLGLAIVRHLVELHGGTIRAANGGLGGAEFTVTFPYARPPVTHGAG